MSIPLKEYVARRERVLKALNGAAAVVLAGESGGGVTGKWKAGRPFWYLTGIEEESGAALLFNPTAENPKHQVVLFLRPLNSEVERWDGYREEISPALQQKHGFSAIFRTASLPAFLTGAARRTKRLACLHGFTVYPTPVSPDLELFRKVSDRVPGVAIEDRTQLLPSMRAIKSRAELDLMKQAVTATAAGFRAAMRTIKPGLNEADIQETIEIAYRKNGCKELAFNSIVGSGINGTVLHYSANNAPVRAGDLIVIDSAAKCEGYAADVTRTLPATGKFTREQAALYNLVLKAQTAAIRAARPGVFMHEVDQIARKVFEDAGYGHAFIHSIGHQLGADVHDSTPDGKLKAGMTITIEPGIYLPEKKIGIRIEDDILINRRGNVVLTAMIPRTIRGIEAAVKQKSCTRRVQRSRTPIDY